MPKIRKLIFFFPLLLRLQNSKITKGHHRLPGRCSGVYKAPPPSVSFPYSFVLTSPSSSKKKKKNSTTYPYILDPSYDYLHTYTYISWWPHYPKVCFIINSIDVVAISSYHWLFVVVIWQGHRHHHVGFTIQGRFHHGSDVVAFLWSLTLCSRDLTRSSWSSVGYTTLPPWQFHNILSQVNLDHIGASSFLHSRYVFIRSPLC